MPSLHVQISQPAATGQPTPASPGGASPSVCSTQRERDALRASPPFGREKRVVVKVPAEPLTAKQKAEERARRRKKLQREQDKAVLNLRDLCKELRISHGMEEEPEPTTPLNQASGVDSEITELGGLLRSVSRKTVLVVAPTEESAQDKLNFPTADTERRVTISGASSPQGSSSARRASMKRVSVRPGQRPNFSAPRGSVKPGEDGSVPAEVNPRNEARCAIFKRLELDGEVHKDSLPWALQQAGFPKPTSEWVADVVAMVTPYTTMNLSEFIYFMEEYEHREHNWAKKLFVEYDTDHSDTLDMEEISVLFDDLGFTPMTHVIHDIIEEVDPETPDELTFDEFWQVMLHLRINEGFTRAEVQHFMELFEKFDDDGSGELESKELGRILIYLGYAIEPAVIKNILKEVDTNGNGALDSREFKVCMRKVQEREVTHIQQVFAECDEDGSGGIGAEELVHILRALGYFPEQEEIQDALTDIGVSPESELDFDQLWRFLEVYRGREGFSRADMAEICEVFAIADKDGSGQLEVLELGHMFAMLGCTITVNQAQRFVANVDIDGSGTLDLREFTKVVRQLSQHACQKARHAFEQKGGEGPRPTISEVLNVLVPSAHTKDRDKAASRLHDLETQASDVDTDQFDFVSSINKLRKKTSKHVKKNHGFGHAEVHDLRQQFASYDLERKGFLCDQEVQKLLEDLYPDLSRNPDSRPELLEIMKTAEMGAKGTVDFKAFLRLVRKCHDLSDREKVLQEWDAIAKTGFTPIEVKEFREIFLGSTDRETVSLPQLLAMISPLVPMGQQNSMATAEIFIEVVGKDKEAEFADFLMIFRRMLDSNIGNINASARIMASGGTV